jgi:hypothetical protein
MSDSLWFSCRSAPVRAACASSSPATSRSPIFGSARHHATGIPSGVMIRYSFSPQYQRDRSRSRRSQRKCGQEGIQVWRHNRPWMPSSCFRVNPTRRTAGRRPAMAEAVADQAGTFVYADSTGNAFTFPAGATSFGTGSGSHTILADLKDRSRPGRPAGRRRRISRTRQLISDRLPGGGADHVSAAQAPTVPGHRLRGGLAGVLRSGTAAAALVRSTSC